MTIMATPCGKFYLLEKECDLIEFVFLTVLIVLLKLHYNHLLPQGNRCV